VTHRWWLLNRPRFEFAISQIVISECGLGDRHAAQRRLELLRGIRVCASSPGADALAKSIMSSTGLPKKADVDAAHIAVAAISGARFLLTWNLKHIAAAENRHGIQLACAAAEIVAPDICTPAELRGHTDD
jgi:hypothetical protein